MKKLCVNLKKEIDTSYPIVIENNILKNIESYLEDRRYFLVTNNKVAKIYSDLIKKFDKKNTIIIKDGEKYKNLKTIEYILNKLLDNKIERKDCIIAFGGGVIGDMAGFCASSVLRGVDFIQIPTTLLSQVDSSVGGKTGFNDKHGKNLIGAFLQPKKVLIDPITLNTLSHSDFQSGMGEVIKYAFIENSCGAKKFFNLFDTFEKLNPNTIKDKIEDIIYACVSIKAAVVEQDEKEKGLRALLNLGHTYAHAIEKLTNYKTPHGQAVAQGIKMALKTSLLRNFIDETYYNYGISIIDKYNLVPKSVKLNPNKALEIMKSDKKVRDSKINLILPLTFAQAKSFDDTDELLIKDSLL